MKAVRFLIITFLFCTAMTVIASAQTLGVVTGNKVNVRDNGCLVNSNILYRVNQNEPVEILGKMGDYYHVNVQHDKDVYIASEYIRVTVAVGLVNNDSCLLYDLPLEAGGMARGILSPGERVVVEVGYKDWLKIDGGYVEKNYIAIPDHITIPEEYIRFSSSTNHAEDIIDYAKTFLGTKYLYGSMSPNRGFDCSGYITYVFNNFDISISRSSASMANCGIVVNRNELEKGDLVFFATGSGNQVTHVGMYIGGGQFIHSSSWKGGVVIDDVHSGYYGQRYVSAVRVL